MTGHEPPPFVHEIMPGVVTPAADADPRRFLGWYFGYSECCVEAFIERVDTPCPPWFAEWLDAAWEAEQRGDEPPPRPALRASRRGLVTPCPGIGCAMRAPGRWRRCRGGRRAR